MFDKDGNGTISLEELKSVFEKNLYQEEEKPFDEKMWKHIM